MSNDLLPLPFKNDRIYISFDADGYGNATILELSTQNLAAITTIATGARYSRDWQSEGGYGLVPREGPTMTFSTVYGSELNRQYMLGRKRAEAKAVADANAELAKAAEPVVVDKADQPF